MAPNDPARRPLLRRSPSPVSITTRVPTKWQRFKTQADLYIKLARLNVLIGTWLTFWPFAFGSTFAAYHYSIGWQELATIIVIEWVASLLLHSAGCVWNDFLDRHVDDKVERTKNRPLASGAVSGTGALIWMAILVLPLLTLIPYTNGLTLILFSISAGAILLYPFLKRITYFPSFFLGMILGCSSLIGWAALTGDLHPVISPMLFWGLTCYIFAYDSLYSYMDRKDDPAAGVKSVAQAVGDENAKPFLYVLEIIFISALTFAGYVNEQGFFFFFGAIGSAGAFTLYQVTVTDINDPDSLSATFCNNAWFGWPVWLSMIADWAFKVYYLEAEN